MSTDEPFDVRSLALTMRAGHAVTPHRHPWAQLLYARSGLMRVIVNDHVWLIPPTRALWIPADTQHAFSIQSEAAFRSLYVAEARANGVGRGLGALEVSPLLSELILHIMSIGTLDPRIAAQDRLAGVLIDLIHIAPAIDLMLPLPKSAPACRLASHFQAHADDNSTLPNLALRTGASLRSLQRQFAGETGMTIERWRQKCRLIASTAALSEGQSVTNAAMDCGYDSPSAFIAAFKVQFGITPGHYARDKRASC